MNRRQLLQALSLSSLLMVPGWGLAQAAGGGVIAARFGALPKADQVRRVFAAGPPAAALLCALAPERMMGWPYDLDAAALELLPAAAAQLPVLGRLAGRGSTVSMEALLDWQPDLILDAGTVNPNHVSAAERVWKRTRLPYVLVDGTLADHPAQLREVGRLLGVAARGEQLARQAQTLLDLGDAVRAEVPQEQRPRVYYGRGAQGMETGLQGSINMEVIAFAGGRNVADAAGRGGITRVSMEQILLWQPEVIVTQDAEFARQVYQDRRWRSIPAVRDGRVHVAPNRPFGWLDGPPGINRLIGVPWLVSKLYPERLAPDAVQTLARAFHRHFWQREWAPDVLAEPAISKVA